MELYILDSGFRHIEPIDNYHTIVWTERYSASGDFTLAVPSTPETRAAFLEGAFIGHSESLEVGIVEILSDENGILTISGPFLTGFLVNRFIRNTRDHDAAGFVQLDGTPSANARSIVLEMCCSGGAGLTGSTPSVPGGALEVIPNLTCAAAVSGGTASTVQVPFGDVYSAIKKLCDSDQLGFTMYPNSITPSSYTLTFKTYRGRVLTRNQSTYPVVAFSSALDSLAGVKEVRSIAGYRNAAFVYAPNANPVSLGAWAVGTAYVDGGVSKTGFERRSMMVIDTELSNAESTMTYSQLISALNKKAVDALANNNWVRMLDGQLVPQKAFSYGVDYILGDVIELVGQEAHGSGITQEARIIEYIRSKDSTGEKAYPTLSVITE